MLTIAGFEVVDLGVDVSPEAFIAAARESGATQVALSGLLTLAIDAMKDVVAAFDEAGLRDKVRIMVGGAPVAEQVRDYTGADGWGADAAGRRSARQELGGDMTCSPTTGTN